MSRKRMLILGASGFIGRNLFDHFSKSENIETIGVYHTRCFEPNNRNLEKADLTNKEEVDALVKGADIIFQAAATTSGAKEIISRPYFHVTDNAVMNSLVFRAAFEHGVEHVLFPSCTVVYPSMDRPIQETDVDLNKGFYEKYFGVAWTKMYIEKQCEFYAGLGRNKFTVLRHSNVYGPHDKFDLEKSHVFGATVAKVMTAAVDSEITVWGAGEERRDLIYTSDLTRFVELAIEKQKNPFEIYNVGLGDSISVKELVQKIVHHSKKNLKISHDLSKPSIATNVALDCRKASKDLGWQPEVGLDAGIQKTLAWYKENRGGTYA